MDATEGLWGTSALVGKACEVLLDWNPGWRSRDYIGLTTATCFFAHPGMVFVPLGYVDPKVFPHDEVHGGASACISGTYAGADGTSCRPITLEKDVAESHGKHFATIATKLATTAKQYHLTSLVGDTIMVHFTLLCH
jgi:NAD(P)H dehydrogenase (quinone)